MYKLCKRFSIVKKKLVYIYTLSDKQGIKYVGKTVNLKLRYSHHMASKDKSKRSAWINKCKQSKEKIKLDVIDYCNLEHADLVEKYWIYYYVIKKRINLVNTAKKNPSIESIECGDFFKDYWNRQMEIIQIEYEQVKNQF